MIPGLPQWVKDPMFCRELWCRSQTWLGSVVAMAMATTALIRPLAWEPPHAMGVALKRENKNKKQKKLNFLLFPPTVL